MFQAIQYLKNFFLVLNLLIFLVKYCNYYYYYYYYYIINLIKFTIDNKNA